MNKKLLFFKNDSGTFALCGSFCCRAVPALTLRKPKIPAMIPDRLQTARILKPVMKPSMTM